MVVRRSRSNDVHQIAQLFHDTIRSVNLGDYTEEQVKAWAPDNIHFQDWKSACESKYTLVAVEDSLIIGFAQLEEDGHIDCFYCHKDFQGQGIGKKLYQEIESKALEMNLNELFVEASVTAKPFFKKMGFRTTKKQVVTVRGVEFINFRMRKEV